MLAITQLPSCERIPLSTYSYECSGVDNCAVVEHRYYDVVCSSIHYYVGYPLVGLSVVLISASTHGLLS